MSKKIYIYFCILKQKERERASKRNLLKSDIEVPKCLFYFHSSIISIAFFCFFFPWEISYFSSRSSFQNLKLEESEMGILCRNRIPFPFQSFSHQLWKICKSIYNLVGSIPLRKIRPSPSIYSVMVIGLLD
jgi:hypothetical protein